MSARVSDLHYVALAVPDLAAEREFFSDTWGLVEVGESDGKVYFAAEGSPHPYVIRLRQDPEKKTDLIGFSADSRADVDALFGQVKAAGAKIISEPASADGPAGGYAFRFFDPDGRPLEVICDTEKRQHRALAKGEAIPVGLSHVAVCHRDGAFARTSEPYVGTSSEIRAQVLDAAASLLRSFLNGRCPG